MYPLSCPCARVGNAYRKLSCVQLVNFWGLGELYYLLKYVNIKSKDCLGIEFPCVYVIAALAGLHMSFKRQLQGPFRSKSLPSFQTILNVVKNEAFVP